MSSPARADRFAQRVRVAVGQRLLLGLAPALLALVLVVPLAYYGEIGRKAPEYVIGGAALLAFVSLIVTWANTRYLVRRLQRIGRGGGELVTTSTMDDLDRIELEVQRLKAALSTAQREGVADHQRLEARLHQQATMLAATLRGVTAQVDEVRLPLHILLDARFGDLNENQEELLVSARTAADSIDGAIRRLGIVADADRDALSVRPEPVEPNEVVRAVLPMVRASAERRGATVDIALEPALPRAWANRAALAESVALISTLAAEQTTGTGALSISTISAAHTCAIRIGPIDTRLLDEPLVIAAQRMLHAQRATIRLLGNHIDIELPRALA